jgi:hypothetical protein
LQPPATPGRFNTPLGRIALVDPSKTALVAGEAAELMTRRHLARAPRRADDASSPPSGHA